MTRAPLLVAVSLCAHPAQAQGLPDTILARLRAGVAAVQFSAESVAVPLVGPPALPLVAAGARGQTVRLLVDLGSNVALLRRDVFAALGGRLLVDRATSDIGLVDRLTLGPATLVGLVVGVYDSLDVDGVLGYNVLQHASFTLDYPGRRLILHHRSLPVPNRVDILPYRLSGRLPYVPVQIGDDSVWANLDTGAAEWMTIPPAMEGRFRWRTPLVPGPVVTNNQTGSIAVRIGQLEDTLRLGALSLAQVQVYVNPDADDAWLGSALLRVASWTFDPQQLRVRVAPDGPAQNR